MRSNGTALFVGLASFPNAQLVMAPAAIYIIFQHLLTSMVKSRLPARFALSMAGGLAGARTKGNLKLPYQGRAGRAENPEVQKDHVGNQR
jgi:hypothetical protein